MKTHLQLKKKYSIMNCSIEAGSSSYIYKQYVLHSKYITSYFMVQITTKSKCINKKIKLDFRVVETINCCNLKTSLLRRLQAAGCRRRLATPHCQKRLDFFLPWHMLCETSDVTHDTWQVDGGKPSDTWHLSFYFYLGVCLVVAANYFHYVWNLSGSVFMTSFKAY